MFTPPETGNARPPGRDGEFPFDPRRGHPLGVAMLFSAPEARVFELAVICDPRRSLRQLTLHSGERGIPLLVERSHVLIPPGVPLPWRFVLDPFETTMYTAADLAAGRPVIMKELGTIRGKLERPLPAGVERVTWFLRQRVPPSVTEIRMDVDEGGTFEFRLPAGLYEGSALGERCASKIRSRILVKPGDITDLGRILCDPIDAPRRMST